MDRKQNRSALNTKGCKQFVCKKHNDMRCCNGCAYINCPDRCKNLPTECGLSGQRQYSEPGQTTGPGTIAYNGFSGTLAWWESYLGTPAKTIRQRMENGWTIEDALMYPVYRVDTRKAAQED